MVTDAYIALGSNLGDRQGYLAGALTAIRGLRGVLAVESGQVYDTAPVDPPKVTIRPGSDVLPGDPGAGGGNFLNSAAIVKTTLSAKDLLTELHRIEAEHGRDRAAETARNGPRTLDLDIVLFGEYVIDEDGLEIPHPRMHQRWFVLKPLNDVAPEAVHPVLKKKVRELLAEQEGTGRNSDER